MAYKKSHYKGLENVAKNFSLRLKELISYQSVRSFARSCNLSETALRKYLNAESTPNLERLIAIANQSGVTVEWLATGLGEKFQQDTPSSHLAAEPETTYQVSPSSQTVAIERIVLSRMIQQSKTRLQTIENQATKSNTPEVWHASIEMEKQTLRNLEQELNAL